VSVGPRQFRQRLGELDAELRGIDVHARGEWSIFASDQVRVDTGFDLFSQYFQGHYYGPAPSPLEGDPTLSEPLGAQQLISKAASFGVVRPGAYVELSYRPLRPLLLVPGVRADYYEDASAWTVDPRFTARYQADDATTLKSGVGLYSQAPEYYEVLDGVGNPELDPYRALQLSGGVERKFGRALTVDTELFYKRLFDRVVGAPGGAPPVFVNDGSGRIYGLEFGATFRPAPRTYGYLAYTLARSERRDGDEAWRLFDSDQTHNLSLAASYDLGAGWLVGARFRYVTGNPTTPIVGGVYDATTDLYRPLLGATNSARLPAFHQLDVRVDKRWLIGPVTLTTYLEVFNVYNAANEEARRYNSDFSRSEGVTGLPLFPNLGIRGEL
jgi:hypothetical protein